MKPFSIKSETEYYFFTDTIVGWQCVFMSLPFFQIMIESLQYCQREKGLRIHGYVIMPNHIHTILSAEEHNLSDIILDLRALKIEFFELELFPSIAVSFSQLKII